VEHIHWHIFPRYQEELKKVTKSDPWASSDQFSKLNISKAEAREIAKKLFKEF
jgi:diadenosine tetraphosphate (Ap4A) HIT family hydrolase